MNNRVAITIDNGIAHVQLMRANKMNALDDKMMDAIIEAANTVENDSSVRVVVLSGQGNAFCAGLDKSNFNNMLNPNDNASTVEKNLEKRTHGIANKPQNVAWCWRALSVPVIAAVHGVAFGGGFQIALAADMRYVAPKTQFSVMEMKWGIVPDMCGTQLMRHLANEDIIRELTYTARIFDENQAKDYGLITQITDDPVEHAMQIAKQIANKNPDAIKASKRLLNEANYLSAAEGLMMESIEQDKLIGSPNQLEAIQAQLEKRTANYK